MSLDSTTYTIGGRGAQIDVDYRMQRGETVYIAIGQKGGIQYKLPQRQADTVVEAVEVDHSFTNPVGPLSLLRVEVGVVDPQVSVSLGPQVMAWMGNSCDNPVPLVNVDLETYGSGASGSPAIGTGGYGGSNARFPAQTLYGGGGAGWNGAGGNGIGTSGKGGVRLINGGQGGEGGTGLYSWRGGKGGYGGGEGGGARDPGRGSSGAGGGGGGGWAGGGGRGF